MTKQSFILKGNICYSKSQREFAVTEQGYLVCIDGISQGVYEKLPEQYAGLPVTDYGDALILPGMTDLHIHGPQYTFRGLGMDLELLEWLETHTFPEESRYQEMEYAKKAYGIFTEDLKNSATTRAVIFATIHRPATRLLMDQLEATGLKTYVGKVNMDRNCSDYLREASAGASLKETKKWLEETMGRYQNTKPILTPRFVPTCSDGLMEGLGQLQKQYRLPAQSHLSENLSEIDWVKELCPWSTCYGDAYDHFGLFGENGNTIMAHCVYSSEEEIRLMEKNGVYIAHCPQSNTNLSSGIAPVREYLDRGLKVGLGTDVAGGANLSMFRCIADAISVSKLRWRLLDQSRKPLTAEEGFYLATVGGGSFFGKVGSFEKGYELDALIVEDGHERCARPLTVKERVERYLYLAGEQGRLIGKYVAGQKIDL